jgi:PPOX class probable F420-dependent enzyme
MLVARVGHLGTASAEGVPHVVPVCFALLGDVVYTAIDHKPKRTTRLRRLANLEANPRACLLVDEYDDDWSRLWWVRLDGSGRVVDDPEEEVGARSALAKRYPQYVDMPPAGPVIALDVSSWHGWSASGA